MRWVNIRSPWLSTAQLRWPAMPLQCVVLKASVAPEWHEAFAPGLDGSHRRSRDGRLTIVLDAVSRGTAAIQTKQPHSILPSGDSARRMDIRC